MADRRDILGRLRAGSASFLLRSRRRLATARGGRKRGPPGDLAECLAEFSRRCSRGGKLHRVRSMDEAVSQLPAWSRTADSPVAAADAEAAWPVWRILAGQGH
jgi:hypothetical protein